MEELGDSVMGLMIADEQQHAWMDEMMGGEGSQQLAAMHRWMGYDYILDDGNLSSMGWGPGMMGFGMMGTGGQSGFGDNWNNGRRGSNMMKGWYGPGHMTGWMSPWMWIVGLLVLVALVAVVVIVVMRTRRFTGSEAPNAMEILKARYARGEISREEYQRIYDELK